jgi:hypothetical protein
MPLRLDNSELKGLVGQFALRGATIFDRHLHTPDHDRDQTVALSA